MTKLTGVIIGCGAIAREHLAAIKEVKNVDVAAVCDISSARAEATAERYGIAKWYNNYLDMLGNVNPNLVHITTPPASHFEIAKNCLGAGLNVLCEKPIAVNYQEFAALKELAVEGQCMLLESQHLRFHSSVRRLETLLKTGILGDLLDVQVCYSFNINGPGSPYTDPDFPHFGSVLRGGVIGDFLPHVAYLTLMFTGRVLDLRTIWKKHITNSIVPADEFRAVVNGERATAYVEFSGNAEPAGLWVRLSGTRLHAETNLFLPPRLTLRRLRRGEAGVMGLVDGIVEARDVFSGTVAGFWRKLGGESNYDGLSGLIAKIYGALESRQPQPITLDEIDAGARLVDSFTKPELRL